MKNPTQPHIDTGKTVEPFLKKLADYISKKVGYPLQAENIKSDKPGVFFYIRRLKRGHPVLVLHYRGPLMLVIPHKDYERLSRGKISAKRYVDTSHWSYGYFQGGGSLIGGVYWQPLESGVGIHDTEKISEYLHIISCQVFTRSCGYHQAIETCQKCKTEGNCPFSSAKPVAERHRLPEVDRRRDFYAALHNRLSQHGFTIRSFCISNDDTRNRVYLSPCWLTPSDIRVDISSRLHNELLYDQCERDWTKLIDSLTLIAQRPCPSMTDRLTLPADGDIKQLCLDFWGADAYPQHLAEASETTLTPAYTPPEKPQTSHVVRFFDWVSAAFWNKFNKKR